MKENIIQEIEHGKVKQKRGEVLEDKLTRILTGIVVLFTSLRGSGLETLQILQEVENEEVLRCP